MDISDYEFDYNDRYSVEGEPKLCWTCLKKYEEGFMVSSKRKLRRIFFCQNCLKSKVK